MGFFVQLKTLTCRIGRLDLVLRVQLRWWNHRYLHRYRQRHPIVVRTLHVLQLHPLAAPKYTDPADAHAATNDAVPSSTDATTPGTPTGAGTGPGPVGRSGSARRSRARTHPTEGPRRIRRGHVVVRVGMRMRHRIVTGITERGSPRQGIARRLDRRLCRSADDIR